MRIILAIVFILCVVDAFAAPPGAIAPPKKPKSQLKARVVSPQAYQQSKKLRALVGIGGGVLIEKQNDGQNYSTQGLPLLRAGMQIVNHEVFLELSGYRKSTGSSGVEIAREHQQVELWYRYLFIPESGLGHPFLGVAFGAQREKVKTDFFNEQSNDIGPFESLASLGGGYRFNIQNMAAVWLEGRLSTSASYEPKVIPGALVSVGAVF